MTSVRMLPLKVADGAQSLQSCESLASGALQAVNARHTIGTGTCLEIRSKFLQTGFRPSLELIVASDALFQRSGNHSPVDQGYGPMNFANVLSQSGAEPESYRGTRSSSLAPRPRLGRG